jgi:hypothetical protein
MILRRTRRQPPGPGDVEFWRLLRVGARLTIGPPGEPAGHGRRREIEIVGTRHVTVPDLEVAGRLRAEFLFLGLRSAGEQAQSLVVSHGEGRLVLRLCATIEDGLTRDELQQSGFAWLCDYGPGGPSYARYPVGTLGDARGEQRVSFERPAGEPLHGEYAVAGSDRVRRVHILEYVALEVCEQPVLLVLDEVDTGAVTILSGSVVSPAQLER